MAVESDRDRATRTQVVDAVVAVVDDPAAAVVLLDSGARSVGGGIVKSCGSPVSA
jgi:hypothetical protein